MRDLISFSEAIGSRDQPHISVKTDEEFKFKLTIKVDFSQSITKKYRIKLKKINNKIITKMKITKKDRNKIINEISQKILLSESKIYLLERMLDGNVVFPCFTISIIEVANLSRKLNNLGLTNAFAMNYGPNDTTWELLPDAVSNYRIMRRSKIINAIIS